MGKRRRRLLLLAAILTPVLVSIALPTRSQEIVGGRSRPLGLPLEPSVENPGPYLLVSALVRHLTVIEVLLGRRADLADAPGEMSDAKTDAWWAAVNAVGGGQVVESIDPASPSALSGLQAGDVLVGVDNDLTNLNRIERDLEDGQPARLRLIRDGRPVEIVLPTSGTRSGARFLPLFATPRQPLIDTGSVEGGSGGLLLALADVDLLTAGDLTGGRPVAATGTVGPDGTVGSVMAYREKEGAAARAGATVFLAPAVDLAEAQAVAPAGLRVIGVSTVTQAVWELCALGGVSSLCGNANTER